MIRQLPLLIICLTIALIVGTASAVTWADAGGCWTATNGSDTIVMWNATGSNTWIPPVGVTDADIVIVAGGASGGKGNTGANNAGAGGAGGVLNGTLTGLSGSYDIAIGTGGTVQTNAGQWGINGTNSSFGSWISIGGGRGGSGTTYNAGGDGGSGGGGGYSLGSAGTATQGSISPLTGYGNNGAAGTAGQGSGAGGATSAGQQACASTNAAGFTSNITGTPTIYSTGGACGKTHTGGANTGEGGDATDAASYAGGSGIIILRYATPAAPVAPIPSFTSNVTSGTAPLAVQFNDTSITDPTAWNWSFRETPPIPGGARTYFSTDQNATYSFPNGNWNVYLNVTNASGYAESPTPTTISVSDSGGLSGWNRQDIMMDQIFTLTLNIKDASTFSGIPGAIIQLSNGDNSTTNLFGVSTFSMNYTSLAVLVGATGYGSRTISYIVDRDRTETIYLTAIPTSTNVTPQTMTYYTPWQVRFRIVDFYGNPLPGTNVTANYMATSLPSTNISWLITAFGVQSATAEQMTDSGVAMAGQTDSNGGLSFTMFKSIQYALAITNTTSGLSATKNIYPSDQEYLIRVPLPGQVSVNNTLNSMANTSLPVYQLNSTAYNLSVIYRDTSGLTDKVLFIVKYRNGTVLYNVDLGNPGTGIVSANYTINNIGIGTEILWSYNARRAGT
jgi:PKD repeat protein